MLRSVIAVILGALISLAVGLLVVFGVVAPIFQTFLPEGMAQSSILPAVVIVFAVAFALYFGGMAAGYRAPSRPRLHGVILAVALFALSPLINIAAGREPFPQFGSPATSALAVVLVAVSLGASYVGASRGASLYIYNQGIIRRRNNGRSSGKVPSEPEPRASDGPGNRRER